MKPEFVHLHLHSQFSLLDGAIRIPELVEAAKADGQRAVAVTDHGNLFAAVPFHDEVERAGLKPILGCEIYVAKGSRLERGGSGSGKGYNHLVLLAADDAGYRNLVKLVSIGYLEGFYYKPRVDLETLERHAKGLIALSACLNGVIADPLLARNEKAALEAVDRYQAIYGRENFYLEIQNHGMDEDRRVIPGLAELARRTGAPLVATNDCHYLGRDDSQAHDVLLCIQTGKSMSDPGRWRFANDQFYFKSQAEMAALFPDHPGAVRATIEIAEKIDFRLRKGENHLPRFEVPPGRTTEEYFREVVRSGFAARRVGLEERARRGQLRHPLSAYEERLEREMGMIERMRFPGYFLIVWDFIRHARESGVPVGPGRGSAAGSLVAWSLAITDIDPLQYDLIFERFLNPERVSMPDIDIDFCQRGRASVIDYVTRKYGRESVAQIITFGTLGAKAAIRDVGRTLGMSYAEVDRVAKLVPQALDVTIAKAIESVPALSELAASDPRVRSVLDLARRLEGLTRHASVHAAGVVIAPGPVTDFCPLYKTNRDEIVTQFAKDEIEKIGLLKMDFLGLKTLTVIDDCRKSIAAVEGRNIRLEELPLDDKETYRLFGEGRTDGVFQFESSGMKEFLRRLKPARFEDLIALNALYRPGPMEMIDDYIKRRHGKVEWDVQLPQLEPILAETYGVIVYQEQVMRIASELAGFTLGQADVLRKAIGKKKADVMAEQRARFVEGCRKNKIAESKAARLFDTIERFASYAFNKSHSAAYALVAYHTAWLKTHYPVHFMAALLTSEHEDTKTLVKYIAECREMGLEVLPPDVGSSELEFTVAGPRAIRFGLGAIKGVGEGATRSLLEWRRAKGRFGSLGELCEGLDLRLVNKRVLECLIKSGALDGLGSERSRLMAGLDRALDQAQGAQRDRILGQDNLFGALLAEHAPRPPALPDMAPWSERERLAFEKETLGFYMSGHPLSEHASLLKAVTNSDTASLGGEEVPAEVTLGGIVAAVKTQKSQKTGSYMAFVTFEDLLGSIEVVVFPALYQGVLPLLEVGRVLVVRGRPEVGEQTTRLVASEILTLDQARLRAARTVTIRVVLPPPREGALDELQGILLRHRGQIQVRLEVEATGGRRVVLAPHAVFRVAPSSGFVGEVEAVLGPGTVRLSGRGF